MIEHSFTGVDPVTKGKFVITGAVKLLDYDEEVESIRVIGDLFIDGTGNELFNIIKTDPLRLQGLLASVTFVDECRLIRFEHITGYHLDDVLKQIRCTVVFEILDNLTYLESVDEYKENNLL